MSTLVDKWEKGDIKTRKVRIYPNKKQASTLKKWMNDARYTYNKALERYKENKIQMNEFKMRDMFVTAKLGSKTKPEGFVAKGRAVVKARMWIKNQHRLININVNNVNLRDPLFPGFIFCPGSRLYL
jgi:hypothetical protein